MKKSKNFLSFKLFFTILYFPATFNFLKKKRVFSYTISMRYLIFLSFRILSFDSFKY